MSENEQSNSGVYFGLGAFAFWGLAPIYYQPLDHISALEILSHRILWAGVVLVILLAATDRFDGVRKIFRSPATLAKLFLSGSLIAINWLVFTWAVTNERLLEVSLGYFINPLFSVVLGVLLLRERLRPMQQAAVVLAAIGVCYLLVSHGTLPWIAIVLPITFGLYGFMRKKIAVDPFSGLLTEIMVTAPVALAYAVYLARNGVGHFGGASVQDTLLLILGGPVTIIPLALFAAATLRLPLSTIGFMQYLAPSLSFLLAVFAFHESFRIPQLVTFTFIWISLIVFSLDGIRFNRISIQNRKVSATLE